MNPQLGSTGRRILAGINDNRFVGDVGSVSQGVCPVTVYEESFQFPIVARAEVRYRVLEGRVTFADNSLEKVVFTDNLGAATIDIRFSDIGSSIVSASLPNDLNRVVLYQGLSNHMTNELQIEGPPAIPADPGVADFQVIALDHHGIPVTGAKLIIQAVTGLDTLVHGDVRELGNGQYEGRIRSNIAGEWRVSVYDATTRAIAYRCLHIVPAEPVEFRLVGDTDPRKKTPTSQPSIRVQLVDRFKNPLDPSRIHATIGGRDLLRTISSNEARFPVSFVGSGQVAVTLKDSKSPVTTTHTIDFAAATLRTPGFIVTGSRFETPAFLFPSPNRSITNALMRISFNPDLASFVDWTGVPGMASRIRSSATYSEPDLVEVHVEAENPITASMFPEGLHIGTAIWDCHGEGDTCFVSTVEMSPASASYTSCPVQKRNNPTSLCVNFMYPETDPNVVFIKKNCEEMAKKIKEVFSSDPSITNCCPLLDVHFHLTPISGSNWVKIGQALGGKAEIKDFATDLQKIKDLNLGLAKPNCFNIYMVEFHEPGPEKHAGATEMGNQVNQCVLDWRGALTNCAHELGHALGLNKDHNHPADNIMSKSGTGTKVEKEQCKTIFQNIGRYGG